MIVLRKSLKCLGLFVVIIVAYALLPSSNVQANPYRTGPPNRWHAHPTANQVNSTVGTLIVTSPGSAYDLNNATSASAPWGGRGGSRVAGTFDMRTFKIPTWGTGAAVSTISQVDIKIRISSTNVAYGSFSVYYTVYPSATKKYLIFTFSTSANGSGSLATTNFVVSNAPEPNNNVWDWTDINRIRIIFQAFDGGTGGGVSPATASIYEAWASIRSPETTLTVDPASIIGAYNAGDIVNFNIKVNQIYDTFGIEFNVTWNPNLLGIRDYWVDTNQPEFLQGDIVAKTKFFGASLFMWSNASGVHQNDVTASIDTSTAGTKTGSVTFPTAFSGTPDVYLAPSVQTEFIYKDADNSGTVTAGDTRLTRVGAYDAGSIVAGGEADISSTLVAFTANEKHRDLVGGTTLVYDVGEPMYRDVDTSGAVSAADDRLSRVLVSRREYFAGTYVESTHSDVGSALVAFAANEKHRENVLVDGSYDPVLTIRNLQTTSVTSTGFSWSFDVTTAQNPSSAIIQWEANYASYMYASLSVPIGTALGNGPSGTGTIATISFRVRGGPGTTTLTLKDIKISDTNVEAIPFTTANGSFENTAGVPEFPLGGALEIALGIAIITFVLKRRKIFKIKPM